jgi:hypothetical protein
MQYILGPRGSGKTTALIELSASKGYYIACRNRQMVKHILILAQGMGVHIPTPITYDTLVNYVFDRGHRIPGVMIDDMSAFIMFLLPHLPVVMTTDTPDGVRVLDNPARNLLDGILADYSNEMDDV